MKCGGQKRLFPRTHVIPGQSNWKSTKRTSSLWVTVAVTTAQYELLNICMLDRDKTGMLRNVEVRSLIVIFPESSSLDTAMFASPVPETATRCLQFPLRNQCDPRSKTLSYLHHGSHREHRWTTLVRMRCHDRVGSRFACVRTDRSREQHIEQGVDQQVHSSQLPNPFQISFHLFPAGTQFQGSLKMFFGRGDVTGLN